MKNILLWTSNRLSFFTASEKENPWSEDETGTGTTTEANEPIEVDDDVSHKASENKEQGKFQSQCSIFFRSCLLGRHFVVIRQFSLKSRPEYEKHREYRMIIRLVYFFAWLRSQDETKIKNQSKQNKYADPGYWRNIIFNDVREGKSLVRRWNGHRYNHRGE
jgi:hypothetical protein